MHVKTIYQFGIVFLQGASVDIMTCGACHDHFNWKRNHFWS